MSFQDPIADMLTRIRNAQQQGHKQVDIRHSKLCESVADVLKKEGYVTSYKVIEEKPQSRLQVALKYHEGEPVITTVKRVSRPGLRVYRAARDLPWVRSGLGIAIISTSHGVMTDHSARKGSHGGEVLCTVE